MKNNQNMSEKNKQQNEKDVNPNENIQQIKWGGLLNEFLWICAGVNRKVLRQCPTDYAKYAGIGGTILFTALMAMLSGGYALYTVFDDQWTAIAFGVFWGLLIFNLDRFIVNTMYSDGKVTISWREFYCGLPRIIMAIFLGIVISTPLELKIFEDEIDSQLAKDDIAKMDKYNEKVRKDIEEKNAPLIQRRETLEQARKNISDKLSKAEEELKTEGEGNALSGKVGRGPIYREKEAYRNSIKKELDDWDYDYKTELTEIKEKITNNLMSKPEEIKNPNEYNVNNGFCIRYKAFSDVINAKGNQGLKTTSIFIMLLFIIIETAPTFFKMMIASGPYDDLLRSEMHRVRVQSDKRISDINDEINTEIQISTQKNQARLEAELLANKKVLEQIASAQAELLQTAIEKWREQELEKISEDPSVYIKTNC